MVNLYSWCCTLYAQKTSARLLAQKLYIKCWWIWPPVENLKFEYSTKQKKLLVVFSLQNWKDCFPLCLESTVKIERGGFSVVRQSQRELHQQGDSWFSLPTKLSNAISFCQSHFQKTGFLFLYLRFGIWPDFPTLATFFKESFEILKPLFTLF